MKLPEPEYMSINEAREVILKCSTERIHFLINEGHINVYVRTPSLLPAPTRSSGVPDADIFGVPPSLAYFWEQPLADYCKIVPPIRWGELVECDALIVSDVSGNPPTPSDLTLSASTGRIGPNGEMFSRIPWRFAENEIGVKSSEARAILTRAKIAKPNGDKIGSKKDKSPYRMNVLRKIILEVLGILKNEGNVDPSSDDVFIRIKRLARGGNHPIIQEVKGDTIYWINKGKEKPTSRDGLKKRLTALKKILKYLPQ